MNVAAIDIGTNSVRLLVTDADGNEIVRRMRITKLGQGVDLTGRLASEAIARTLATLGDYREEIDAAAVGCVEAAATSAVRDADNGAEFLDSVREVLGVAPRLISGDAEARLCFAGATAGFARLAGASLVVDIGGGSTEFVIGDIEVWSLASVNIGCVRITERFLHSDQPSRVELEAARNHVREVLGGVSGDLPVRDAARLIGVAGTVTTLAALAAGLRIYDPTVTHGMRLSRETVDALFENLAAMPLRERRSVLIEPARADVIVGGTLVLAGVIEETGFDEILVSEQDILDGLAASVRTSAMETVW